MAQLAYNISPRLTRNLNGIEELRRNIALSPVAPKVEIRLRWEANLERVYYGMQLSENSLNKSQISKYLTQPPKKTRDKQYREVLNYKATLNYIQQEWTASFATVNTNTIRQLYNLACRETKGAPGSLFRKYEPELAQTLEYLQAGRDHPVTQAGVAYIQLMLLSPFTEGNGVVARLLAYLFLHKYGYDFRNMLILEEFFANNATISRELRDKTKRSANLTLWLEFFTWGVATRLKSSFENLKKGKVSPSIPSTFWKLNDRQKEILNILDNPEVKVTNKDVQNKFKVSQITASRDLAHLTNLGLTTQKGKGRSTYYIRL